MKKVFVSFVLVLLALNVSFAQDSAYARQIISALSSDKMYGRGFSHRGDSIAAAFLAQEMSRLGVLPLQDGYFQYYSHSCYGFDGMTSLRINGVELEPYSQYRVISSARGAEKLTRAQWATKLKDGTWVFGVGSLDTYGPIVGRRSSNPVCIEVLNRLLPDYVDKVESHIPIQYHRRYLSQNVVGYVEGVVDTMVVFTAHYDHCGTMGDDVIFPGAHDNASGVAAVLDLARMATERKPYYTMVFMLFSGEESGLLGSKYAADNPLIDFDKVKLLCNIDMFCGGKDGLMIINGKSESTEVFYNRLKQLSDASSNPVFISPRDNRPNSDHWWFSTLCPSIFVLTMGGPYGGYHDPDDTCSRCGLEHYVHYLSLIWQMVNH